MVNESRESLRRSIVARIVVVDTDQLSYMKFIEEGQVFWTITRLKTNPEKEDTKTIFSETMNRIE
jgi:hypothetical protein